MSQRSPNVTKLIIQFIAREAVPAGGGIAGVLKFFQDPEHRKMILESAETKVIQAIESIKAAPDNPYGNDDEFIAGELLKQIAERKSHRNDKGT